MEGGHYLLLYLNFFPLLSVSDVKVSLSKIVRVRVFLVSRKMLLSA